MKLDARPMINIEASMVLNLREIEMLNLMCSYGMSVTEPFLGKIPESNKAKEWDMFLSNMRSLTDSILHRFKGANDVFMGYSEATRKSRQE